MSDSVTEQFLTQQQIAERYGVHVMTVRVWKRKGEGPPSITIGGSVRYKLSDVLVWEQARTRNGGEVA